jgi:two-component system, cell cycle response regulator DivK
MSRTILVIEDNEEERKIFSSYLQFVGVRLIEASNGAMGLALAREHLPDLILMDLTMPVMNGWEAIMRLQAEDSTREIPVIAITAHHLPPERLEEAGFCGYLEKPLAPYRVLEEVERCLGPLHGISEKMAAAPRERAREGSAGSPDSGQSPGTPAVRRST